MERNHQKFQSSQSERQHWPVCLTLVGAVTNMNPLPSISLSHRGGRTLWDQNFREWTSGIPLTLSAADMGYFAQALWNDTHILSKLLLMDYSLLVIVSPGLSPRQSVSAC